MRHLAHTVRLRVLGALADRPRSVSSLAQEFGVSDTTVRRHLRVLESMGLAGLHGGSRRTYTLMRYPVFDDDAWEAVPLPVQRAWAMASLTQMHANAAAAIETGGFDRRDMHLTRTSIRVSEERWEQITQLLRETLMKLYEARDEGDADDESDGMFQANVSMMAFTGEHVVEPGSARSGEFGESEALERVTDIVELLGDLTIERSTPWERIEALAAELRLVSRAAINLDSPAPQPAAERQA
jgi:DNA-binding transcriptional ArsR family regulator